MHIITPLCSSTQMALILACIVNPTSQMDQVSNNWAEPVANENLCECVLCCNVLQ